MIINIIMFFFCISNYDFLQVVFGLGDLLDRARAGYACSRKVMVVVWNKFSHLS